MARLRDKVDAISNTSPNDDDASQAGATGTRRTKVTNQLRERRQQSSGFFPPDSLVFPQVFTVRYAIFTREGHNWLEAKICSVELLT